jgi:DNA-directed RNA polymerase specialized sigma24 family protein
MACPGLDALYGTHYRSLFRLAALLTCDTRSAEAVVQDSFAAMHRLRKARDADEGGLARLQRLVVARARRAARHGRLSGGRPSGGQSSGGQSSDGQSSDGQSSGGCPPGMAGRSGAPHEAPSAPNEACPAAAANGAPPAPQGVPLTAPGAPPFEDSAVVRALRALPAGQREAVVLTLYLQLTHDQAAAAMQVSPAELRRDLAAGRTALRAALPAG